MTSVTLFIVQSGIEETVGSVSHSKSRLLLGDPELEHLGWCTVKRFKLRLGVIMNALLFEEVSLGLHLLTPGLFIIQFELRSELDLRNQEVDFNLAECL